MNEASCKFEHALTLCSTLTLAAALGRSDPVQPPLLHSAKHGLVQSARHARAAAAAFTRCECQQRRRAAKWCCSSRRRLVVASAARASRSSHAHAHASARCSLPKHDQLGSVFSTEHATELRSEAARENRSSSARRSGTEQRARPRSIDASGARWTRDRQDRACLWCVHHAQRTSRPSDQRHESACSRCAAAGRVCVG